MTNPYGITLDSEWIEWATKEKAPETVAAAVLLICETRPVHEVVAKLTPGEFERVMDIVRRSPDHFPPGALAALKSRGAMLGSRPAAAGQLLLRGLASFFLFAFGCAPCPLWPGRTFGRAGLSFGTGKSRNRMRRIRCWRNIDGLIAASAGSMMAPTDGLL